MRRTGPTNGFTLVELMIALLIAATLGLLAAPGFFTIQQESRVASATNRVQAVVGSARSTAVKEQADVRLCPVDGDWQQGLYATTAAECGDASGEDTQRVVSFKEGFSVRTGWPVTGLVFDDDGFVSGGDDGIGSFTLTANAQAVDTRMLTLTTTGVTRLTTGQQQGSSR